MRHYKNTNTIRGKQRKIYTATSSLLSKWNYIYEWLWWHGPGRCLLCMPHSHDRRFLDLATVHTRFVYCFEHFYSNKVISTCDKLSKTTSLCRGTYGCVNSSHSANCQQSGTSWEILLANDNKMLRTALQRFERCSANSHLEPQTLGQNEYLRCNSVDYGWF